MFFSISKESFDERFTYFKKINDIYVSLDLGWEHKQYSGYDIFIKGYSDDCGLDAVIADTIKNPIPQHHGNYGIILIKNSQIIISHSYTRPFPIWAYNGKNSKITNLPYEQYSVYKPFIVWENTNNIIHKFAVKSPEQTYIPSNTIIISGLNKNLELVKYNLYDIDDFDIPISLDNCIDSIGEILRDKKTQFLELKRNKQLKVYISGGLDTMSVYSLIADYIDQSNFEFGENIDDNEFLEKNLNYLNLNFSHYQRIYIHHWNTPTILTSGVGGDEFFFKESYCIALWAAWKDINFINLVKAQPQDFYRRPYFLRPTTLKIFDDTWNNRQEIKKLFPSYKDLCQHLVTLKTNEFQHWHLCNTITWSPLQDVRILKLILRLNDDDLIQQMLYANIDFSLINKSDKKLKQYISKFKNLNDHENLLKFKPYKTWFVNHIKTMDKTDLHQNMYRKLKIK